MTAIGDKAIVEVGNIPFFSKSVSLGDHLLVALVDNCLVIESVVERGGHSTYRIFIEQRNDEATALLGLLKDRGCDWEKTFFRGGELYAVDVFPETDIHDVYQLLEIGQREGAWLFEEGYVGHAFEGPALRRD
ncbi:DUF4265 domain-containing protein [Methylosinus sp. H3A]|uniref:DUF4265 domain-containing protein n=1 Tax=Methylosinus sp. H3A TaxID=2785786 RepID=UPI0018C287D8|nr:DUF4265 domain-containing protein [Methylosinus sp. H3A]MBG0808407.1 DUF4265 domain-containing protein [Methylosinus sp. H3A]